MDTKLLQVSVFVDGRTKIEQKLIACSNIEKYSDLLKIAVGDVQGETNFDVIISNTPLKKPQVGIGACAVTLDDPLLFSFIKGYEFCSFFGKNIGLHPDPVIASGSGRSVNDALLEKTTLMLRNPAKNDLDKLYNEVCEYMTNLGYKFQRGNTRAIYWAERITAIIWSLALSENRKKQFREYNQHKSTKPLPEFLRTFKYFNDFAKKHLGTPRLCVKTLRKSAEEVLNTITSPMIISSIPKLHSDMVAFGEFLNSVAEALEKQNLSSKENHERLRDNSFFKTIRERPLNGSTFENLGFRVIDRVSPVPDRYKSLDEDVRDREPFLCLIFDESRYFSTPLLKQQRYKYFNELGLSVNIALVKIHIGGSMTDYHGICRLPDDCLASHESLAMMIKVTTRFVELVPSFHTRAMKDNFSKLIGRVVNLKPFEERFIYKAFTNDSSADQNQEVDQRLVAIALADPADFDLILDVNPIDRRTLNEGRPKKFDEFLNVAKELIAAEYRAEDDRRNNEVGHLAKFISIEDLHSQITAEFKNQRLGKGLETLDEDIPSTAWLRLQFVPGNVFSQSSTAYTGELDLTYSVQRRQIRKGHPDAHYCNALFRYWKEYAIIAKDFCTCLFLDDKAKVIIGEPGEPVSTGVRGRRSITKTNVDIESLDHDQNTKCSLTPSVILMADIPDCVSQSFYRGVANVCVKDTVLTPSNPFRHAVELFEYLKCSNVKNPILFLYTDGGVDHRCNLLSVKLSLILLFKELNLDFLCIARTAPNHSYVNPAERVMSTLNYGLQNCALERRLCCKTPQDNDQGSVMADQIFKTANGMDALRQSMSKDAALKTFWRESIDGPLQIVKSRFSRLKYSGNQVTAYQEASIDQLTSWENMAQFLFPDIPKSFSEMSEFNLSKSKNLKDFLESHCNTRTYHFEIKKCGKIPCEYGICGEVRLGAADFESIRFLPDPIVDSKNEQHYLPFQDLIDIRTSDDSRPSVVMKDDKETTQFLESLDWTNQHFIGQNARDVIKCSACNMTRVIYSKKTIKGSDKTSLKAILATKTLSYRCGSQITEDGDNLHGLVLMKIPMKCRDVIEKTYFSAKCFPDICFYCGTNESVQQYDAWKLVFKTPYPVCQNCSQTKPAAGSTKLTKQCFQKKRKIAP